MEDAPRRSCPYCKAEIPEMKREDWDCPSCGRRIVVRRYMGTVWLLTEERARAWDEAPPLPTEKES